MKTEEVRKLVEAYYDLQKIRIETENRITNYIRDNSENLNYEVVRGSGITKKQIEKLLKDKKYSMVKDLLCQDKLRIGDLDELVWFRNELYRTENDLAKRIERWVKEHKIYKEFLRKVRGVGPILSAGLISWIGDISRFSSPSKLWKYCGLSPDSVRKKGEKLNYNPKLKTLCWKIWNNMLKARGFGYKLYLEGKELCARKHPDWTKGHIHNWAGRRTVKVFLSCLWDKWRELEGLPRSKPYPIQFLGHTDIVTPSDWIEKNKEDV